MDVELRESPVSPQRALIVKALLGAYLLPDGQRWWLHSVEQQVGEQLGDKRLPDVDVDEA